MRDKMEQLAWLKASPIAHRGLHALEEGAPENSMAAFMRAVDKKYAIELDVYVTKEKFAVVFHDETLDRACGVNKDISDLSKKHLDQYRLFGTTQKIPLLSEVLDAVNGQVPLLIEIKRQPNVENANMVIRNTLLKYEGPLAIQSFDPFILWWFSNHGRFLKRGQLSSDFKEEEKMSALKKYILKNFLLNRFSKPHFLAYDIRDMPNRLLERKRKKGMIVLGWTVQSADAHNKIRAHCDNIIFEGFDPSALPSQPA